jgi:hypothetical protein
MTLPRGQGVPLGMSEMRLECLDPNFLYPHVFLRDVPDEDDEEEEEEEDDGENDGEDSDDGDSP